MDIKIENQVRGTRIMMGDDAKNMRTMISTFSDIADKFNFKEVILPTIELANLYTDKMGPEILNQMYTFNDKGDRQLVLRPEGTATVQAIAREIFKNHKDVKLFYTARCFRYEKPQAGRYREFTQFGVEWLWPRTPAMARDQLITMMEHLLAQFVDDFEVQSSVKRGLAYYIEDGFEATIQRLGAQKQVCGGGAYPEGIGFAIGIDRLLLAQNKLPSSKS